MNRTALVLVALLVLAGASYYLLTQPGSPLQTSPTTSSMPVPSSTEGGYGEASGTQAGSQVEELPKEPLSEDEIKALLYMREEEKLARDVYLTLYEKWGIQIFKNIAESEQRHTDMVKALIEKYGLKDPAVNEVGKFTDPHIQELYNALVAEGEKSEVDALKVGAKIEELDIKDIREWLEKVDNEDIRQVFNNLINGSMNHLRSFVSVLKTYGVDYQPQIISQEEFERIVSAAPGSFGQGGAGGGKG